MLQFIFHWSLINLGIPFRILNPAIDWRELIWHRFSRTFAQHLPSSIDAHNESFTVDSVSVKVWSKRQSIDSWSSSGEPWFYDRVRDAVSLSFALFRGICVTNSNLFGEGTSSDPLVVIYSIAGQLDFSWCGGFLLVGTGASDIDGRDPSKIGLSLLVRTDQRGYTRLKSAYAHRHRCFEQLYSS